MGKFSNKDKQKASEFYANIKAEKILLDDD